MDDHLNSLVRLWENGVVYRWRVTTLWEAAKGYPTEEVPITTFDQQLDEDRWFQSYIKPTVKNIIRHFARIHAADLRYPIILSPTGTVLDGIHRIAKAQVLGISTICIVRLIDFPPSDFANDDEFVSDS